MTKPKVRWTDVFRSRRMAVLFALGFSSGLPLSLTGSLLTAWGTVANVDIKTLAAFPMIGLAYTFKFTWAPLLDRYRLPFLGRRRGWMLVFQLGLVGSLIGMAMSNPTDRLDVLIGFAVLVAFFSASQDVVLDAYATDLLEPHERAAGAAIYVMGYRVAFQIFVGTVGLILADFVPFRTNYLIMAGTQAAVGIIATLFAEEPAGDHVRGPRTLAEAFTRPFQIFYRRFGPALALVLLFVATYKFGDFLLDSMKIVFYKRALGFSFTEIATVNKAFSIGGAALGAFIVGIVAARIPVRRSLFIFGALAAVTNLLFILLASMGKSYVGLGIAVGFDSLAGTMGNAVFVAYLMSLCNREVSAAQYALLTSLSSVGSRVFGWTSGPIIEDFGWSGFFVATALMVIPSLILLRWLPIPTDRPRDDEGVAKVFD